MWVLSAVLMVTGNIQIRYCSSDLADIQDIDDIPTQARNISDPNVTSFGSFVIAMNRVTIHS